MATRTVKPYQKYNVKQIAESPQLIAAMKALYREKVYNIPRGPRDYVGWKIEQEMDQLTLEEFKAFSNACVEEINKIELKKQIRETEIKLQKLREKWNMISQKYDLGIE